MADLERILPLWRAMEAANEDYVLATVVRVEGPSYRKPGACMILTSDGRRAGTVSGGCLEAEVASRAWWLTANGPALQRYSTAEEDGERPWGSGCGGVVYLLLERRRTASALLAELERAFGRRTPLGVATILEGPQIGRRAFAGPGRDPAGSPQWIAAPDGRCDVFLQNLVESALEGRASMERRIPIEGTDARTWANYRPARPGLWIFGAGDDAQPLLRMAKELGWYVAVADGRSHLATRERFSMADELHVLPMAEPPATECSGAPAAFQNLHPEDAAVVMTHSFDQDAWILASLMALSAPPAYIGVLGPQRRTRELLAEAASLPNQPHGQSGATLKQAELWLAQLHAPTGLDLGADAPETIALSILAEVQKTLAAATALPLKQLRGAEQPMPGQSVLS